MKGLTGTQTLNQDNNDDKSRRGARGGNPNLVVGPSKGEGEQIKRGPT